MKKKTMLYLLFIFSPVILFGLYVSFMLVFGTVTDFHPKKEIVLQEENSVSLEKNDSIFTFLSWNIGYGSLGKNADFFLDGGKNVRSKKPAFSKYFKNIKKFLAAQKDTDFILLQEVDKNSKRSFFTNEFQEISSLLNLHSAVFAVNFQVKYIPVPLTSTSPLGKVESGLASFSKYKTIENIRLQFPGEYEWPKRIFHLDRCLLLKRIPLSNGKDLVVINSHNSAYDGGKLKPQEMSYLKELLLKEYAKGNFIVVGSDWNQCPPNFDYNHFSKNSKEDYFQSNIEETFMPNGWTWAYDNKTPTNRKLSTPYNKAETFTTIIDFYLV